MTERSIATVLNITCSFKLDVHHAIRFLIRQTDIMEFGKDTYIC